MDLDLELEHSHLINTMSMFSGLRLEGVNEELWAMIQDALSAAAMVVADYDSAALSARMMEDELDELDAKIEDVRFRVSILRGDPRRRN